ncbi:GNAT family N-acetyltransferase [candidate division WWE3 bacterium]|nr:GNAT family N-acetyltransferase [candidate division WWE3 bacterium]
METIIKIIRGSQENFEDIHKLTLGFTAFNVEKSGKPEEFYYKGWKEGFGEEINDSLDDRDSYFFVAYVDGVAAGYILCRYCENCYKFEIDELYVDQSFRQHGLGKRLLDSALEIGRKYNVPITLEVFEWNKDAESFYIKNGFKSDGRVLKLSE